MSTGRQGLLDITEDENVDLGASPRRFGYAYLFSVDGFFDNVNVVEGRRPSAQTDTFLGRGGASMPLLEGVMSGSALDRMGMLVGDVVGVEFSGTDTGDPVVVAMRIVGRVVPLDARSNYWIYPPRGALDEGGIYICLLYTSPSPRD